MQSIQRFRYNQLKRAKLFPTLILLLIPALGLAQKTSKVTHYHYKKLKSAEGVAVKGQKQGIWTFWNTWGYVEKTVTYRNDTLHGPFTIYRDGGAFDITPDLRDKEDYAEALHNQQNPAKKTLKQAGTYNKGLKHGTWRQYMFDTISDEINYRNDTLHGPHTSWYLGPYGVESIMSYDAGVLHGIYKRFTIQGKVLEEGHYVKGKKDGEWTTMQYNTRLVQQYRNDTLHGKSLEYATNGSLESEYIYVHGIKHGPFASYYGKETTTGNYVNGKTEGVIQKHRKGRLYSETLVHNGKENGYYRVYDSTGNITLNGFFKNGKPDSTWMHIRETETCRSLYKNGETIWQECLGKNGVKTKTTHRDNNGYEIHTEWYNKKQKQSEYISADIYEINTSWNEKGKLLQCDTVWYPLLLKNPLFKNADPGAVYDNTAAAPKFKGGYTALQEYIRSKKVYPQAAIEMGYEGRVYIEFIVTPQGAIDSVKLRRGIVNEIDKEALYMVKQMPAWTPGMRNGKPVKSTVCMRLDYVITDDMRPKPVPVEKINIR